jgi:pseudouridine kinase
MSKPVICIGAALVDELLYVNAVVMTATTNEATATKTAGGVSRNIAEQLCMLDVPAYLISVFGDDGDGAWLIQDCRERGINTDACIVREGCTGKYTGVIDNQGNLFTAFISNSSEYMITPEWMEKQKELLLSAFCLLADTNVPEATMTWLLDFSKANDIPLIIETVSVPPARKLKKLDLDGLYLITPNEDELPAVCMEESGSKEDQVKELLNRGVKNIWYHGGLEGSLIYSHDSTITLHAPTGIEMIDCTGAGDSSLAGFILGKWLGKTDAEALQVAHTMSAETIQVKGSIARHLDQPSVLSLVSNYYP